MMINKYKYIFIAMISLLLIIAIALAYNMLIGKNITEIAVNPVNGNIAMPTYSNIYSKIVITDSDLNPIRTVHLNELFYIPCNCAYSRDGSKLYVTIADMAQTGYEIDYQEPAFLAVIDTTSWLVTYYDLPLYPDSIYVPIQNDIIYITCGLWRRHEPTLIKMNTTNGQIMQITTYGGDNEMGGFVAMNREETKIYIHIGDRIMRTMAGDEWRVSTLKIYDNNFQFIKKLYLTPGIVDMVNAPGDKLYIAHSEYDDVLENVYKCITVLDTVNDEIEIEFEIPDIAGRKLAFDENRNFLYISPLVPEETYDAELDWHYIDLFPVDSVIRLDLYDWSYTWINVADETIGPIALSPDGTRLYAAAVNTDSQKVYYEDIF